jgi:hypothetical protein
VSSRIAKLTRRPMYKKERAPARTKGILRGETAPAALPDANSGEVALALFALADEAGVIVGRAGSYDNYKDEYTVIGKSKTTGKAQDFIIHGREVADVIVLARFCNGGPLVRAANRKAKRRSVTLQ